MLVINNQEKTITYSMAVTWRTAVRYIQTIPIKYEKLSRSRSLPRNEFLCCCPAAAIYIYKPGDGGGKAYCAIAASSASTKGRGRARSRGRTQQLLASILPRRSLCRRARTCPAGRPSDRASTHRRAP